MLKPAANAHANEELQAAIEDWEETVSDWKSMWVNLDYVVHMNPVSK